MSRGPSPHLSWEELACKDGTPYPEKWRETRAKRLAEAFEGLRARCGNRPIRVGSGYRTRLHNVKVGGARHSYHMKGMGLDLYPPWRMNIIDFVEAATAEANEGGLIRGIGVYRGWLHIDVRSSKRLIRWRGSRIVPEPTRIQV